MSGIESNKPTLVVESDSDSDSDFDTPIFRARGLKRSGTPALPTPPATVLRAAPPTVSVENTPGYANYIQFEIAVVNSLTHLYVEMIPFFPEKIGYKFSDEEKTMWEQFNSIISDNPLHMKSFPDLLEVILDAKEEFSKLYTDTDAEKHVPHVMHAIEHLIQKVRYVKEHAASRVMEAHREQLRLDHEEK